MNVQQMRFVGAGLFFLFIFGFGYWLSHSGKPFNVVIFTVHKLISLGAFVFLAVAVYQINQAAKLGGLEIALCAMTALLFVGTMATGGLVSVDKPMPGFVLILHRVTPYLTAASTALMLYWLQRNF